MTKTRNIHSREYGIKLQFIPALLFFAIKKVCVIAVHIPVTLYVSYDLL